MGSRKMLVPVDFPAGQRRQPILGSNAMGDGMPGSRVTPPAHPCGRISVSLNLRFVSTYRSPDRAWQALADGTRRAIVERLAHGPLAVGELARDLPVSRPAVSQHLKVLKTARLVCDRPAGTRRVQKRFNSPAKTRPMRSGGADADRTRCGTCGRKPGRHGRLGCKPASRRPEHQFG